MSCSRPLPVTPQGSGPTIGVMVRSKNRVTRLLSVAAIATALMAGCGRTYVDVSPNSNSADPPSVAWVEINEVAPTLPLSDPVGASRQMPDSTGVQLVNIWASTCAPCRQEMPLLNLIAEETPINIVGLSRDRYRDDAEEFVSELKVEFPTFMDNTGQLIEEMDGQLNAMWLPATVILQDGVAFAIHLGEIKSSADVRQGLTLIPDGSVRRQAIRSLDALDAS